MRVGHGSALIHVPDGTPLGGYADRVGGSLGVLDPVAVHAVVFTDRLGESFALLTCDVVCVNEDLVGWVRKDLGDIGIRHTWLSATHTHSGPDVGCQPGGARTPARWIRVLRNAMVTATEQALRSAAPASGVAYGCTVTEVASIRSSSGGSAAVDLDVIAVRDAEGLLAGLLVVVPIHSTVLPAANRAVSADLLGGVRRFLERTLSVWVVVAAGAAGDISTRHLRHGQTMSEVDRLAAIIGKTICAAIDPPGRPAFGADSQIAGVMRDEQVPRMPKAQRQALLSSAAIARHETRRPSRSGHLIEQATRIALELPTSGTIHLPLGVVRLGELILLAIPGEPFLAASRQVVDAISAPAVVIGYANGYVGYLPTYDAFESHGYETLITAVRRGSAEQIMRALVAMADSADIRRMPADLTAAGDS